MSSPKTLFKQRSVLWELLKNHEEGSRERRVAAGPVAESDRRPADDRRGESRGTARDGRRDHTRPTPTSSAVIRAAAAVILSSASEDTPEAGVVLVLPSGSQSRLKNASVSHGRRRTFLDAAIAGVSHGRSANGCSTIAGRRPPDADHEAGGAGRRSDSFRNSAWPLAGLCPCRTWADNTRLLRPVQGGSQVSFRRAERFTAEKRVRCPGFSNRFFCHQFFCHRPFANDAFVGPSLASFPNASTPCRRLVSPASLSRLCPSRRCPQFLSTYVSSSPVAPEP